MGKPSVIAVNKWDLIDKNDSTAKEFQDNIYSVLYFIDYAPMIFISCLSGQRVGKTLEFVNEVYSKTQFRVSTGVLNEV